MPDEKLDLSKLPIEPLGTIPEIGDYVRVKGHYAFHKIVKYNAQFKHFIDDGANWSGCAGDGCHWQVQDFLDKVYEVVRSPKKYNDTVSKTPAQEEADFYKKRHEMMKKHLS